MVRDATPEMTIDITPPRMAGRKTMGFLEARLKAKERCSIAPGLGGAASPLSSLSSLSPHLGQNLSPSATSPPHLGQYGIQIPKRDHCSTLLTFRIKKLNI
jgi:hypothetical protein